jgi:ribosomal protein S18 acetylase RimI-like enzyme
MNENGIPQWDDIYPSRETFKCDIEQESLFVAFTPGQKIAGCIVLNCFQDEEYKQINWEFTGGKIAVIHRLMVLPEYEGAGVAKDLLAFAEACAGRKGFEAVRLDMFKQNRRAVAFYKKHGYITRGTVQFRKGEFFCAEKILPGAHG